MFRQELGAPLLPDTPTALMRKLLDQHNRTVEAAAAAGAEAAPTAVGLRLLPVVRLHDLRHLHASLLLKAGVPVHVVAHRLGHADPPITLCVYAHVLDDQASHAATAFADVLSSMNTQTGNVSPRCGRGDVRAKGTAAGSGVARVCHGAAEPQAPPLEPLHGAPGSGCEEAPPCLRRWAGRLGCSESGGEDGECARGDPPQDGAPAAWRGSAATCARTLVTAVAAACGESR